MKTIIVFIITILMLTSMAYAAESMIWGNMLIGNILSYGTKDSLNMGPLFTILQSQYFRNIFLVIVIGVPAVFLMHYLVLGARFFSHDGKKVYVFSLFNRLIHLLAAISFLVLIPTGLMMIFGVYFGGGPLVMTARHLHGLATALFFLAVIPMFFFWVADMLPTVDDIKWIAIFGGYLSRKQSEVPAGKFNAGQKMWFWIATLGGIVMIATGAAMYFQDFNLGIASAFGLSQIDLLRASAIVHNIMALLITALFITHVYMSLFAVKGAINSMITGYKEEQELKYLHSSFYRKLKAQNKI